MTNAQRAARFLFYSVWAVLMTSLTYVLGGVSLKVLRRKYGRLAFWGVSTLISAAMFGSGLLLSGPYSLKFRMVAVAFFSLVAVIGVFSELEELGLSLNMSTLFTILINALFASGAFVLWVVSTGPKWHQQLLSGMEGLVKPWTAAPVDYAQSLARTPSAIIVLWLAAIYLAVLLEARFAGDRETVPPENAEMKRQMWEFRLPDPVIWVFIGAMLFAWGEFGNPLVKVVAENVLNVCLALLFFQGVAVSMKFFEFWRVHVFLRVVFVLFIMVQIGSVVGLMDYWFDFRARLAKRRAGEVNRET